MVQSSWLGSVNLASPEFKTKAYGCYAQLREAAPVVRVPRLQGEPGWLVTRYDDCAAVLKDERFIKNRHAALSLEQKRH